MTRPTLAGRMSLTTCLAWILYANCVVFVAQAAGPTSIGAQLYRAGRLPNGQALVGRRADGTQVAGPDAACTQCHRRSGLGAPEGALFVPPIIGRYLFRDGSEIQQDADSPHIDGYRPTRPAYDRRSFARALREGVASDGRPLSSVMPRYALADGDVGALADYLGTLHAVAAPGVEPDAIHVATVVTPDADPVARDAMLAVLDRFFAAHNASFAQTPTPRSDGHAAVYRIQRHWILHTWILRGAPDAWARQLSQAYEAQPVLAVLSGLGSGNWKPVHRFCESHEVACLLPNVDVPVVAAGDFYPVYFSRGVDLEAELMATALSRFPTARTKQQRVVIAYRPATAGEAGARAFAARIQSRARATLRPVGESVGAALRDVQPDDVVALWLAPADLSVLGKPVAARVLLSGLVGGLESTPLPLEWRRRATMTFPVELPDRRRAQMAYTQGWLRLQGLAVQSPRVQSDTYLACQIFADAIDHSLDAFYPDYLVERVEMITGARLTTGYYPRLSLASTQRFASKGGYLVTWRGDATSLSTGEWIVP